MSWRAERVRQGAPTTRKKKREEEATCRLLMADRRTAVGLIGRVDCNESKNSSRVAIELGLSFKALSTLEDTGPERRGRDKRQG